MGPVLCVAGIRIRQVQVDDQIENEMMRNYSKHMLRCTRTVAMYVQINSVFFYDILTRDQN